MLILFYQTIIFLLGASIASFFNAWAMRIISEKETILDPSRCRFCNKALKWYQLIPIISWILQHGKCGCQQKKVISLQYLFTEISLGLVFVILFASNELSFQLILYLIFASILFFLFVTDIMHQLLHLPSIICGIILGLTNGVWAENLIEMFIGGMVGFLVIYLINIAFRFFKNKDGFGSGDKYLLAMFGTWLGPIYVLQALVLASWIGVLFALFYKLKKAKFPTMLPFAPLVSSAYIFLLVLFNIS